MTPPTRQGFTLLELLIAIAIVGILASMALPSYQESARKSKRAEGTTTLLASSANLERIFSETNQYQNLNNAVPASSEQGHYNMTFAASNLNGGTNNGYTVTATPSFTDANCGNLTLNQNGVRGCTGSLCTNDVNQCW